LAFIKDMGTSEPRPGRPGVLFGLNADAGRLIGVEIGVGFISVAVTDMAAQLVWHRKIETTLSEEFSERHQRNVLRSAERLVQEAIKKGVGSHRLFGIGVGVPGLVDQGSGTLLFAPNLHWRNVPIRERWSELFAVPVIVENEANAAALGEQMFGNAQGVDDFIYLSAGVGLGGGIVVHGKLYGGSGGLAGEVGHMTIVPDGPQCNCGNRGCWETLVSPTAIIRQVREAIAKGRSPSFSIIASDAKDSGALDTLRMDQVLKAAAHKDPVVVDILNEVGRYLGIGIANLVNIFNPSLVVMGGVLSLVGPYVLARAQEEVKTRSIAPPGQGMKIILSRFKSDACVMGGVSLILRRILSDPGAWRAKHSFRSRSDHALVLQSSAL